MVKKSKKKKLQTVDVAINKLKDALNQSVGDAIVCPHCGQSFTPETKLTGEALDLYRMLCKKEG